MGAGVFSGGPDHAPLHGDFRVPPGASSSASHARAPLFDTSTSSSQGLMAGVYALSLFFWYFLVRSLGFYIAYVFYYLLIYQDSSINSSAPFPVSSI